jgi:4-amino-4-deoxy-L-arabinose transferase-like glycosyltransferase
MATILETQRARDSSAPLTSQRNLLEHSAIVVLSLVALLLRAWKLSSLGLSHFDEGVYANSGFWSLHSFFGPGLDPWQKLFSPPGYFGLVGLLYRLAGHPSEILAIGINLAAGTATVPLVYWIGRRWFSRAVGIFSAVVVAGGEFQIAYSRTALTDTLFSFLFLLSLALIAISLERQRWLLAMLAGLAVGASWNVKYHGWLILAIALLAIVIKSATSAEGKQHTKKLLSLWCVAAGVAFLCFVPWLLYTELQLGGYGAVEEFHRRFADFRWMANLIRQAQMQVYFEGWLSRIAPAFALLAAAFLGKTKKTVEVPSLLAGLLVLLTAGFVLNGAGALFLLSLLGVVMVLRQPRTRSELMGSLLVSTFAVFFVLTPLYRPYARLLLPWMLASQLLAGVGAAQLICAGADAIAAGAKFRGPRLLVLAGAAVILALLGAMLGLREETSGSAWSERTGSRDAAMQLMKDIPKEAAVFVVGEPQVCFYFRKAGYQTFCIHRLGLNGVAQDPLMYTTSQPVFIAGGKYARDDVTWQKILNDTPGRFENVETVAMQPGDIRLQDDLPPGEIAQYKKQADSRYRLELLRLNRQPRPNP